MSRNYSKKDRRDAALICAISASSDDPRHWYSDIADALGASAAATCLASDALVAAYTHERYDRDERLWPRADDALAERLIIEGFQL